ncbi:MAG: hypothetical protein J6V54_10910 [Bacteroidales bacterium]|nr:hypothetical protein [Bacteroidales bacterium]
MKKVGIGLVIAMCFIFSSKAQTSSEYTDTLSCPIISFNFAPWLAQGAMNDMFTSPMLDFGVSAIYKTKTNFLFGIEGSFFFGNDNLKNRCERLQSLYTEAGTIIGTGGTDAGVEAYNRGLIGMLQVGKIIPVIKNNPNSGIFFMFGAGIAQNQIIYTPWMEEAPQLSGDYVKLYDHQQRGALISERVGFWYMNRKKNYLNFHISFEFTQMWLKSTREYVIDDYMGIRGKDNNKYFSHLYGIKFGWMIPLEGKTTQEYYYY